MQGVDEVRFVPDIQKTFRRARKRSLRKIFRRSRRPDRKFDRTSAALTQTVVCIQDRIAQSRWQASLSHEASRLESHDGKFLNVIDIEILE
jgi:hypothetical protein